MKLDFLGIFFVSPATEAPCDSTMVVHRSRENPRRITRHVPRLSAQVSNGFGHIIKIFVIFGMLAQVQSCGYPGAPSHSIVSFSTEVIQPETVATYECESGFELLGPVRRTCNSNNTWTPPSAPFCVLNVAAGKAPMQSTILQGGIPQKAVDGSTNAFFSETTCTQTEVERNPWWYVNLLEPYMIQLVRVDFGRPCCPNNQPANIVVRVGNSRPDLGANPICGRFTGLIEEGRPLFIPCTPPLPGAFVSIHMQTTRGGILSICEAFVYTDQALPIESCPSFRDQPLGSTATYNGRCFTFYNNHPMAFDAASRLCREQGGNLVDETSPALQGFLSWELWRRHRNDPSGQYWMGAIRDPKDPNNWKWLNGQDVTVSFWNLPGGNDNCSRFDGTKGWLWSDTNCNLNLNFICQYRPTRCGIPERPPNSTILTTDDFTSGTMVEYLCNPGHILIGASTRTCLPNGFYTESTPFCRYLECGRPSEIPNGRFTLLNGTSYYQSLVQYSCDRGYALMGEDILRCEVQQTWNGPPPRCESIRCPAPEGIANGGFRLLANATSLGAILEYFCNAPGFQLDGPAQLRCNANGQWDNRPPTCAEVAHRGNGGDGPVSIDSGSSRPQQQRPPLRSSTPMASGQGTQPHPVITITVPPPSPAPEQAAPEGPSPVVRVQPVPAADSGNSANDRDEVVPEALDEVEDVTPAENAVAVGDGHFTTTVTITTTPAAPVTTPGIIPGVIRPYFPEPAVIDQGGLSNGPLNVHSTGHRVTSQTLPNRPALPPFKSSTTTSTLPNTSQSRLTPPATVILTTPTTTTLSSSSSTTYRPRLSEVTIHHIASPTQPSTPNSKARPNDIHPIPSISSAADEGLLLRQRPSDNNRRPLPSSSSPLPPPLVSPSPRPKPSSAFNPAPGGVSGLGDDAAAEGDIVRGHPASNDHDNRVPTQQNAGTAGAELRPPSEDGKSDSIPQLNSPESEVRGDEGRSNTRLNLGGIIALSVFGGFVVMAAFTTIIVILCRRSKRSAGSLDNTTISTDDSLSSESRGLNKYYKRAWDNLRCDSKSTMALGGGGLHRGVVSGGGTIEGLRDTNEMTVNDATAWNTRADRKDRRHHHHHHHHHHGTSHRRSGSPDSIEGREENWNGKHRRH